MTDLCYGHVKQTNSLPDSGGARQTGAQTSMTWYRFFFDRVHRRVIYARADMSLSDSATTVGLTPTGQV